MFDESANMIDWGLDFPDRKGSFDIGRVAVAYPVRVDPTSGAVDTLPPLRYEQDAVGQFRIPFGNALTFSQDRNGSVWFALIREYTISHRSLEGDTVLVISLLDVEPAPVLATEVDSILKPLRELQGGVGTIPTADQIPATKPVLVRLVHDGAGHLLVFPQLANRLAGTFLDVFNERSGEYLGRVDLPIRLETNPSPVAIAGHIFGVTKGDLDVPQVIRLDLNTGVARR
jgi:hypothetical protein